MQGRNEDFFNNSEEKLLLLVGFLSRRYGNTGITIEEALKRYNERFKILDKSMDDLLDSLVQMSILSKSNEKYYLTPEGEKKTNSIVVNYADYSYSKGLIAADSSETFRNMAIKLHGKYLGQFDMTDYDQLQKLFSLVKATESDNILDFGCGLGYIIEYLQHTTGAHCTGLDIASGALDLARKRNSGNHKLDYIHGDMNNPDFPTLNFNIIISIDTLYFVSDLNKTVENLKRLLKPGGRMFIFYSQREFGKPTDPIFAPDGTKLAQAVQKLGLKYDYYNFTENERKHWELQSQLLKENMENYLKEHNEDLFYSRQEETKTILENTKRAPSTRYLYDIKV